MGKYRSSAVPPSARGRATVAQMLRAGVRAFARFGPQGVTTRQLAEAAGVNSAAIAYYFGGKIGYYHAVIEYLVSDIARPVLQLLEAVRPRIPDVKDQPEAAAELLAHILREHTMILMRTPHGSAVANILAREQLNPTPAFDVIYERIILPMHRVVTELVAAATQADPDAPATILRAHALIGQVIGFRLARATLNRRLGWSRMTRSRAEAIADTIADLTVRALYGMGAKSGGAGRDSISKGAKR